MESQLISSKNQLSFFKFCYQIKQALLEKNNKRWRKIANRHVETMFCENETNMKAITKR
jgi:hypothetical protein